MTQEAIQKLLVDLLWAASDEDFFVDCSDYVDDHDVLVESVNVDSTNTLIVKLDDETEFQIEIKPYKS